MMMNDNIKCSGFFVLHILLIFYSFSCFDCCYAADDLQNIINTEQKQQLMVPIGVVLDMSSSFGVMVNVCIDMAISDFYSAHPTYTTRLQLHKKDAKTVLHVNSAVLELAKDKDVVGILGPPQGSIQETLAAAVGQSFGLPIISFASRSSDLSYTENPYFVRTTLDDSVQAQALAAISQNFKWPQVVILYEDTEYGNHFLSHLIKAYQDVDIGLAFMTSISISAEDSHISKELDKLKAKQTRVFLVHMNPALGYRLFALANTAGMMSEEYAWIITDSLSIFLNSIDYSDSTRESMGGVLGIRPHVFPSKTLKSFQERWKLRNMLLKYAGSSMELNMYGLWAYDTVTALAIAAEKTMKNNGTNNTSLKISSSFRPRLLSELSRTKFRGLIGDFQLINGVLKPSAFEIFNLIGSGEKRVGFWTPDRGITRELSTFGRSMNLASKDDDGLKNVMWPGDSTIRPKGWSITPTGKLRVGVPWKPGFKHFVDVKIDPVTNKVVAAGFSVDIFLEARKALPFPFDYEFICYNDSLSKNWSYDHMLSKMPKEYDMVVADITIWYERALSVDFTVPYSEPGVVMVVRNKAPVDWWIFVRPLSLDLWVAIIVACILMGLVLRILEKPKSQSHTAEAEESTNKRPGTIYWSPIAILAFQERSMVSNNWSVFVLVCWLFMAFILMQSFTANLSAILTVDQLKFEFSEDHAVGYHVGSFMKTFLMDRLHIDESRLRPYASMADFHEAMTKGTKHKGVDVIFDEIPYMKLFLNKYGSRYKIVGPTYKTDGFGFAFPFASPLVANFSRAILNVTQGPLMSSLEQKNFGPAYSKHDPLSSVISQGTSGLTLSHFAGLFLLIGSLTVIALFCSETTIGRNIICVTENVIKKIFSFRTQQESSNIPREDGEEIDETGQRNETSSPQDARVN